MTQLDIDKKRERDSDGEAVKMNAVLRRLISCVPQGNTLLMGMIAENMRTVKRDASDEEIFNASAV